MSLLVHNASSNSAVIWSYLSWAINFTLSPEATQQASRSSCMQMRVDFYSIGLRLIYFLCCVHNRLSFRGWIAHVLQKINETSNFWTFVNLICGQYFTVQDFFNRFFFCQFIVSLFYWISAICLPFFLSGMFGLCRMLEEKCMTLHNDSSSLSFLHEMFINCYQIHSDLLRSIFTKFSVY